MEVTKIKYFLSTSTIQSAYEELVKMNANNPSILHTFFLLKGCGYNNRSFLPIDLLIENCNDYCRRISYLFSPQEQPPSKYDFINPFNMKEWSNNPSEPMEKWSRTRVKNNIIGGATTWRKIIIQDLATGHIKFTYNYIKEIINLTIKSEQQINIIALSIWANRFTVFDRKVTIGELCSDFKKYYNITNEETNAFFNTNNIFTLDFSEQPHDASLIRKLIGTPKGKMYENWTNFSPKDLTTTEQSNVPEMEWGNYDIMVNDRFSITPEYLENILNEYYQIILSGPPGTSKSHHINLLTSKYDVVRKVQFHPQYSYQQFIGGYVVEKTDVIYKKGILLDLLDKIEKNKKYLLVIDEINRANVSQVFGELIQCLDRNDSTEILVDSEIKTIRLPKNLHIIASMNSSDRTLGSIDHALRRRFLNAYYPPTPDILIDLCPSDGFISLSDLLKKINNNLFRNLKNRELCIGHAIFLSDNVKRDDKYYWTFEKFEVLFNLKILPIIEEYCYGNENQIKDILGDDLPNRLQDSDFKNALLEFVGV